MPAHAADRPFVLTRPLDPERLKAFREAVVDAARNGPPAIDLDAVGLLDAEAIAALISILRDVRAVGSDVVLYVSRKSVSETLRITGLDKVFTVEAPPPFEPDVPLPAAAPVPRRRSRFVAGLVGAVAALAAALVHPASAEPELTPQEIVAKIASQNPDMRSYEAQLSVDFHLQSFPYLSQHLDGTTYFKRPNNYEVVFTKVPSYAKGFEHLYSDIGDPSNWDQRFAMTVVGERDVDGHHDVVLRLVQKVRGMIDHQDVAVDTATWHIDDMQWFYYNGGTIAMSQDFVRSGDFSVLAGQHVTIRIPFVHAAAVATYTNYRTNVAIDDSIFTKAKKQ